VQNTLKERAFYKVCMYQGIGIMRAVFQFWHRYFIEKTLKYFIILL
jgi:hypothetical protein